MNTLLILIIMFTVVMGPSFVIAAVGFATIKALSRNPSAASKIFLGTILVLVLVEVISVMALLIIFQLFGA